MAANGVIGITAQIMESSDLTGGKEQASPSMSIFQRIAMGLRNIKRDFKSLVKNKSTGILFLLLSSSTIARTLLGQTLKMVAFMLDLLISKLLPVITWILVNVSKFIKVVSDLLDNIEKWFKDIFSGIYNWVRDHAVSLWPGIAEAFGWEEKSINVDDERDALLIKLVPEITVKETETFMEANLIEGGTIPSSYWNPDMTDNLARPDYQGDTDAGGDANETGRLSWIYQGGPSTPPGGYLNIAIQDATEAGDIKVIDREVSEEDRNEVAEDWFSWTDDLVPFGWDDILNWAAEGAKEMNVTPQDLARYIFGTWESTSGPDAITAVIDKTISSSAATYVEPAPGSPGARPTGAPDPQQDIDTQLSNLDFDDTWTLSPE